MMTYGVVNQVQDWLRQAAFRWRNTVERRNEGENVKMG
jgi:hypothetical protein